MTRVAVVGAHGMLGSDLVAALRLASLAQGTGDGALAQGAGDAVNAQGAGELEVVALTRADFDVTNADGTRAAITATQADVIVNCTAWNRVDDAENMEAEAFAVNADGPANLAAAARATGARLIHVSTDYVFDGSARTPIAEGTPRGPVSAYGRSKAAGEERALALNPNATAIVRTAWLYGEHGPSFPRTMLRLAAERETLTVVTDQVGQPTWTRDLAEQLVRLINAGVPTGIYHGTNSGQASWYEFAREIFRLAGLDPERIEPTDSTAFVRPAPRPAYSVLGHEAWAAIGMTPMRSWQAAIAEAMALDILRP